MDQDQPSFPPHTHKYELLSVDTEESETETEDEEQEATQPAEELKEEVDTRTTSDKEREVAARAAQSGGTGTVERKRRRRGRSKDFRETEGEILEKGRKGKKKRWRKYKDRPDVVYPSSFESAPFTLPESVKAEEEKSEKEVSEDEDILCLVARTALILPITFRGEQGLPAPPGWLQKLKAKTIPSPSNPLNKIPVWKSSTDLPKEVADLSPQFRQLLGWKEPLSVQSEKTWTRHKLVVNEKLMEELFVSPKLCTIQDGERVDYPAEFNSIELYIYPLNSVLLVLNINWLPADVVEQKRVELTLPDMRTLLFVAKYRHKVSGAWQGWGLTPEQPDDRKLSGAFVEALGEDIYEARYLGKTVSLSSLGNWLLHLPGEDPNSPSSRFDAARHANHMTTVVINKQPSEPVLYEYLFHLRRAFGQKNRPPPHTQATAGLGRVLVWRKNRYIGQSREGIVSLSWPLCSPQVDKFELVQWHAKFQGVYLQLALDVHGERMVLFELSDLAATQAEELKLVAGERSLADVKRSRDSLRNLASIMARYTLAMSSSDCGGTSEYAEFFSILRQVFGIPEVRDELSNELKDVLAVVESNYLEEERRQRDATEHARRSREEVQREIKQEKAKQEQVFQITISILTSFSLPFVLISGLFGMNLKNLPVNVDFWALMGGSFASAVILLAILVFLRFLFRSKVPQERHQA